MVFLRILHDGLWVAKRFNTMKAKVPIDLNATISISGHQVLGLETSLYPLLLLTVVQQRTQSSPYIQWHVIGWTLFLLKM